MTQSQTVSESLRFLEDQAGFHRNKVPGYKEAVESMMRHLPTDEDFSVRLLEDLRQFQGFHIVQLSKIIPSIKKFCVTGSLNFQSEVKKFLEICQREEMVMDISVYMKTVLDILSSEEATENTLTSLDSTMTDLNILYKELAGAGAINLRETEETHNFYCSSEYYHPSRTFLECYDVLKRRLHQENGRLMINSTVSLIRVEKARKVLGDPHSCKQGLILRSWLKLLRTPYISNNLAILVAKTERDHCDRAVELFGNQQSGAGDQCLKNGFPIILPEVVAATDKLNSHAKDQNCEDDVVFQMMRVPGSFDIDLSDWMKTTFSQTQMEERWEMLLKASLCWKQLPLELTKLFLNSSLANKDFGLILRVQGNETDIVTCVINFLKRIDVPKEDKGERAGRKTTDFIRIFFILLSLFHQRIDNLQKSSDDLVKCFSENVSAEELEVMANALLAVAKSSVGASEILWQVLVRISCNDGIGNKAELWDKYLNLYSSLQWDQERFLLLGKALALLSGKNALLLLDQVQPDSKCVHFLCYQVIFFNDFIDGDINRHFSLISSIIQGTAVEDEIIEALMKISVAIMFKQTHSSIPGSVYDALVVAIAGSVAVGTYAAIMDDRVSRFVTCVLFSMSEPIEVIAFYLKVKCLLVRAWNFSLVSHGQRTAKKVKQSMTLSVPVLMSDCWMNTLVNGTVLLLSGNGSFSQKMSFLTTFYSAVCRDRLEEPQELQNALECLHFSVEQNECNEYRNSVVQFMEELLKIPNILKVLGREVSLLGQSLPVVASIKISVTSSIIKRFPESIKTKEALQVYHLLAPLANTNYVRLLSWICLAAALNLGKIQDFLQEIQIVTKILRNTPTYLLSQATDCLVASYNCGLSKGEKQLLFREIREVKGVSMYVHTSFNICELFVRGWQRFSGLQGLRDRLLSVMAHLDEADHRSSTAVKNRDLFCKELHWLFLETNLSPADIALCIRLCSPSFDQDNALLQEDCRSWLIRNVTTGIKENVDFPSPIRVAYTFLVTLRCNFGGDVKKLLVENLLRAVFKRDSCVVKATNADGTSFQERSRTAKEAISDAITLITSCTSVNQLMLWLESPRLLTCCHATNVVLGACKWRIEETDTDLGSRMDINRKCKSILENAMESQNLHSCLRDTPTEFLLTILLFNLGHILSTKLLDLFIRNVMAALACGKIVWQWQSIEQGMKLLEKFISLWPEETCKSNNIDDYAFEFTYLLLIMQSRQDLKSAEHVFRLWNRLHAQRKLGEHHPLFKAIVWREEVFKSRIDPAVASSWLAIFHAAKLKVHEVNVVTSLTAKSADLLIPGSTYIDDCLFASGTVNKILVDGEVDKSELKFYLTLARTLYDALMIVQRLAKEDSPYSAAVIAILQEASKKLCESAKEHGGRTSTTDQSQPQGTLQPSTKDLYIHRQYLKKVFIEMFGRCESNALLVDSFWEKSNRSDSILVLLRRWLAAIATHAKMSVLKGHMDQMFSVIVRSNLPTTEAQHCSRAHSSAREASPSNFVDDKHDGGQVAECPKWTQMVQDYVVNLKDNQACIARLQSAGYNQGRADLWRDPCLKLTGVVHKRQDVRNLEETDRIHRHICKEYLVVLKDVKIESIDIDGKSIQVRELFSRDLSLEELDQQISAVREKLQELQDDRLQAKFQPVFQLEDERRGYIKILREHSVQESKKKSVKQRDAKTFTIEWENRFFEAIKLCSETIPACYAPNGFHSHKPIQCALCADSQIISVFEGSEEVENVEVKLLEAGMFVYGLHRGRHEMATDELWAQFYKFLLEERLVPKIILSRNSPAFGWAKRFVGYEGEEKLDASKMKFHETVIPMEESYYDSYPSFEDENGKDVHTAALTLTVENVQRFVFLDLKRKLLSDEVMSGLRYKLLEKFEESDCRSLLKRLGGRARKVCGRVITDNLSASEIESNLKLEIDVTKLCEDGKAGKVGVQWFVETIVDLIMEKRPKQDT